MEVCGYWKRGMAVAIPSRTARRAIPAIDFPFDIARAFLHASPCMKLLGESSGDLKKEGM